jgi:hypothetical protein
MHARSRLLLCSLTAAALVLGCSDDEPEIDEDADQELVEDVALTLDDLPDGFEEQAEDDDDDDEDDFEGCEDELGVDLAEVQETEVAEAGSDVSFVRTDDSTFTQIASTVVTFSDPGPATRQLEAFQEDAFVECAGAELEAELGESSEVTDFAFETTSPAVDGDASAAFAVQATSNAVPISMEMHFVVVDRVGITVIAVGAPDGIEAGLVDEAFDTMLARLEEAQG